MKYIYTLLGTLLWFSNVLFFFGYINPYYYKERKHINTSTSEIIGTKCIDKVLLIIVDSLRAEMIYNRTEIWSNIYSNRYGNGFYQTIAHLQPPSLSYAKLKTILTGTVSNFNDVLYNLNSGALLQDNLLDILINYRHFKFGIAGDNLWVKLFPNKFLHSSAFPSLNTVNLSDTNHDIARDFIRFLNDTDQMDFGITHFTLLDHLGHIEGPYGPHINKSLKSIDEFINQCREIIIKQGKINSTLMILTSDHGMNNHGGHGGSTLSELTVPMIFMNPNLQGSRSIIPKILQTDLAPTIALLTGVPIPLNSVGIIPEPLLRLFPNTRVRRKKLLQNYEHLKTLKKTKFISNISNVQYFDLHDLQKSILDSFHPNYNYIQIDISITLTIVLWMVAFMLYNDVMKLNYVPLMISLISVASFLFTYFFVMGATANEYIYRIIKFFITGLLVIVSVIGFNVFQYFKLKLIRLNVEIIQLEDVVAILCTTAVCVGKVFPEFVSDEYISWYQINVIMWIYVMIKMVIVRYGISWTHNIFNNFKSMIRSIIVILFIDRIGTYINYSGNLNTDLIDFGDILLRPESRTLQIISTIVCFLIFSVINWYHYSLPTISIVKTLISQSFKLTYHSKRKSESTQLDRKMTSGNKHPIKSIGTLSSHKNNPSFFVYLCLQIYYGIVMGKVLMDYWENRKWAVNISWICFIILFILVAHNFIRKVFYPSYKSLSMAYIIILFNIVTTRPFNLSIWTFMHLKALLIQQYIFPFLSNHIPSNLFQLLLFHVTSRVSYYQLGNSNSLTSIDVVPGFTGQSVYSPLITDTMEIICMFSPILYWLLQYLNFKHHISSTTLSHSNFLNNSFFNINLLLFSSLTLSLQISSMIYDSHAYSLQIYAPALMFSVFTNFVIYLFIIIGALFNR